MPSREPEAIVESPALLEEMLDAASRQPARYLPGVYWRVATESAVRQIRRHGLNGFRGEVSGLGTGYADNLYTDVRSSFDTRRGRPAKLVLERLWPLNRVFGQQVALTRDYARDLVAQWAARMSESETARDLLARYQVKNSLLGGCVAATRIDGQAYSLHHIRMLELIDRVRRDVDLESVGAMFEIGGGFGALVQLMLDNFSNLRKVVYLDVVPNLYVGTCYLRTLFGAAVRDFAETSSLERISFRDDDSREILAIAPWQIEKLDVSIDLFWNAHSFVEMPSDVVSNYAQHVLAHGGTRTAIVLANYGGEYPDRLSPKELPTFFPNRQFTSDRYPVLDHPAGHRLDPERDAQWETHLFVSSGEHAPRQRPPQTAETSPLN